ncbi:hypothetical protein BaRGS_00007272 [Batillaria attramentaria]|uniref:Uncharacterized protein n=1 Tax=Batillaria attramentaria TaxID=370345 RepID=A0ABD0LR19_9CAEN
MVFCIPKYDVGQQCQKTGVRTHSSYLTPLKTDPSSPCFALSFLQESFGSNMSRINALLSSIGPAMNASGADSYKNYAGYQAKIVIKQFLPPIILVFGGNVMAIIIIRRKEFSRLPCLC